MKRIAEKGHVTGNGSSHSEEPNSAGIAQYHVKSFLASACHKLRVLTTNNRNIKTENKVEGDFENHSYAACDESAQESGEEGRKGKDEEGSTDSESTACGLGQLTLEEKVKAISPDKRSSGSSSSQGKVKNVTFRTPDDENARQSCEQEALGSTLHQLLKEEPKKSISIRGLSHLEAEEPLPKSSTSTCTGTASEEVNSSEGQLTDIPRERGTTALACPGRAEDSPGACAQAAPPSNGRVVDRGENQSSELKAGNQAPDHQTPIAGSPDASSKRVPRDNSIEGKRAHSKPSDDVKAATRIPSEHARHQLAKSGSEERSSKPVIGNELKVQKNSKVSLPRASCSNKADCRSVKELEDVPDKGATQYQQAKDGSMSTNHQSKDFHFLKSDIDKENPYEKVPPIQKHIVETKVHLSPKRRTISPCKEEPGLNVCHVNDAVDGCKIDELNLLCGKEMSNVKTLLRDSEHQGIKDNWKEEDSMGPEQRDSLLGAEGVDLSTDHRLSVMGSHTKQFDVISQAPGIYNDAPDYLIELLPQLGAMHHLQVPIKQTGDMKEYNLGPLINVLPLAGDGYVPAPLPDLAGTEMPIQSNRLRVVYSTACGTVDDWLNLSVEQQLTKLRDGASACIVICMGRRTNDQAIIRDLRNKIVRKRHDCIVVKRLDGAVTKQLNALAPSRKWQRVHFWVFAHGRPGYYEDFYGQVCPLEAFVVNLYDNLCPNLRAVPKEILIDTCLVPDENSGDVFKLHWLNGVARMAVYFTSLPGQQALFDQVDGSVTANEMFYALEDTSSLATETGSAHFYRCVYALTDDRTSMDVRRQRGFMIRTTNYFPDINVEAVRTYGGR